jgi:pyrroline-5-carboxylate reductase
MSLLNKTIAFIGAGNMAEALIRGLHANKVIPASRIIATDVRPERLEELKRAFGIHVMADNATAVREADIIVLAVKPQQMSAALSALTPPSVALIISIAAGITASRIERELGGRPRVIRVMPNTPALVGAGTAALAKGKHATDDDLQTADEILKAVGITVHVDEKLLDAVTALSGSGPAYVFYVTEAMIQAGIAQGLSAEDARKLAVHTVFGAGILLAQTGEEPAELRLKVTSPGGTTEAALKVMQERKLADIFNEAIAAAARRGRELSGE